MIIILYPCLLMSRVLLDMGEFFCDLGLTLYVFSLSPLPTIVGSSMWVKWVRECFWLTICKTYIGVILFFVFCLCSVFFMSPTIFRQPLIGLILYCWELHFCEIWYTYASKAFSGLAFNWRWFPLFFSPFPLPLWGSGWELTCTTWSPVSIPGIEGPFCPMDA